MYVLSPTFFKNSNTVNNRLQHDFQLYVWELYAPTLYFFFHGLLIIYATKFFVQILSEHTRITTVQITQTNHHKGLIFQLMILRVDLCSYIH